MDGPTTRPRPYRSGCEKVRPGIAPGPSVPPTELLARCPHPLEFGRGVVLPLPYETLLMRLEVGDAMPDLLALGIHPIHRWHPVRLDEGARYGWFDTNALRKRHRLFDERIEIGFPNDHGSFLRHRTYRHKPSAAMRKVERCGYCG